jgi:ribulose-5-phosphate 4-epimerase/fuculose-1-phosphate aldolase
LSSTSDEDQLRIDLAAAYRLAAHFQWDDLIYTHISARVPGPEHHFLINPYGMLFEEITASSLVKIDLEGNIIKSNGYSINKAGFTIHSAVHAAREDAICVMHLHTVAGTAVASQAQGLLPCNQTSMVMNGQISYHDYEGLALNLDERPRLVNDLGQNNVLILRNHGTLTLGRTVAGAFQRMYFLERACQIQIAATAGGAKLYTPDEKVQGLVAAQVKMQASSDENLLWPALLRKLDRLGQSDFRN